MLKFYFVFCLLGFSIIYGNESSWKKVLDSVNEQIEQLEKEKSLHLKKKSRHEERAVQCQFNRDLFTEMRREFSLADREEEKVRLAELKIKQLENERAEILKEISFEP